MEPNDPTEDALVALMAALGALFEANQGQGPASRAKSLAREARRLTPPPSTVEQHVIDIALAHVAEEAPRGGLPQTIDEGGPWATFATESIALAWAHWVAREDERALGLTDRLTRVASYPDAEKASPTSSEPRGLLVATLLTWSQAVEALVRRDEMLSHERFQQALILGGAIGFEDLPLLQWTCGATFFHEG